MAKRRPSGDGMVRRREDGRWEGRIVVGHKENGESIFRYVSAKSQKALMKKLHRSIEEYRDVDLSEDSRMPLGEWLDRWLEEYVSPVVRESTLKGYRQYIECYIKPRLGDRPVCKVTAADVQALYREVQKNGRKTEHPEYGYALSGSTVRSLHGVLHQAMDAAVRERLTARNPTEDVTLPKKKTAAKQILNNEQLERFMEEIKKDPVWCDFFYTELTTGMRRGEICGLMWSDFDGKKGTLTVRRTLHQRKGGGVTTGETKTGKGRRTITLPPSTAQLLRERQKRSCSQWIFPNPLRPEDPVNPGRAYSRLKTLLKSAGLPGIRFHDLRPHLRHSCPDQRRGRQDPLWYPGTHQSVIHPGHLYPRHWRYAPPGGGDRGWLSGRHYGEGVRVWRKSGRRVRERSVRERTDGGRAGWLLDTTTAANPRQRMCWLRPRKSAQRSWNS